MRWRSAGKVRVRCLSYVPLCESEERDGRRIPVRVAVRPLSRPESGRAAAERCLLRPPRLTQHQTRLAERGQRTDQTTSADRVLRIAHVNSRSLLPSLDDVIDILGREKIDVLCVSETWLQRSVTNNFVIVPGYNIIGQDRTNGRGGGTCIIYKTILSAEPLSVPTTGSELETLWLSFGRCQRVVIGVAYRPPRVAVNPQLDDLRDQLAHLLGQGRTVYLLGDLNHRRRNVFGQGGAPGVDPENLQGARQLSLPSFSKTPRI